MHFLLIWMKNRAGKKSVVGLFKYIIIFFCSCLTLQNAISKDYIDSLKVLIPQLDGQQKLEAIQMLAYELQFKDLEEYYEYSKLGFEQALADNDSNYVATFLIEIGYYHKYKGEYKKSLSNLERAKLIAERKDLPRSLTAVYTALGSVYHDLGLFDKALAAHSKSLQLKEEFGNRQEVGVSYNNIGLIYYKLDAPEKAIEYYDKALAIKLEFGDTARSVRPYINKGLAYAESEFPDKHEKAIENFKKAIELAKKYNRLGTVGYSYNGLANVFVEKEMYDSAKYYLNLSNEESFKNDYRQLESSNFYVLAKIAAQESDYSLAINYLERSQDLLKSLQDKYRIKNNYGLYAEIYEQMGMLDSAIYYQKQLSIMKDSIFNEELANKLANVQIAAIEEQTQKQIADKDETISKTKQLSLFLLSILALSIAFIVIIFRNYAQISKINRQLNESKNKIEAQKENLEKKNAQLAEAQVTIKNQNDVLKNINVELDKKVTERTEELNQSNIELEKAVKVLDQFIYKTSHDLRGPIATMQGIINVAVMEKIDATSRDYFNTLHRLANDLNNVLVRLIEVHETYQNDPVFTLINPEQEIRAAVNSVGRFSADSEITIVTDLQPNGQWKSDEKLFGMIVQNMLRSAILYKDRGESIISVKSEYRDKDLLISIEDNGYGIVQGDEKKVFDIFFKGYPRPGGTGLEIYTSKMAAEKLGGNIKLRNPVKNTVFEITLPFVG